MPASLSPLREKILDPKAAPVIFEIIPPSAKLSKKELFVHAKRLELVFDRVAVDGINIPEVRNESREGERTVKFRAKSEPRVYHRIIQELFGDRIELIVNRVVVHLRPTDQEAWFLETWHDFDVRNLILVGGESSASRYPGPSVTGASDIIAALNDGRSSTSPAPSGLTQKTEVSKDSALGSLQPTDFFVGGITIPTRRKRDEAWDEPNRLIEKVDHGIRFFTSQIVYEAESVCRLIEDYQRACDLQGKRPKRIFLSFAPVTNEKDAAFLQWLGVEIPNPVRDEILSANDPAHRSIQVASRILRMILSFVEREEMRVPLGLNVEHIRHSNFEIAVEMIEELTQIHRSSFRRLPKAQFEIQGLGSLNDT